MATLCLYDFAWTFSAHPPPPNKTLIIESFGMVAEMHSFVLRSMEPVHHYLGLLLATNAMNCISTAAPYAQLIDSCVPLPFGRQCEVYRCLLLTVADTGGTVDAYLLTVADTSGTVEGTTP